MVVGLSVVSVASNDEAELFGLVFGVAVEEDDRWGDLSIPDCFFFDENQMWVNNLIDHHSKVRFAAFFIISKNQDVVLRVEIDMLDLD